jgi:hypothetical protein
MRSNRAEGEGSRRMTSAIWELSLPLERTSSPSALLTLCSEASFGHAPMRRDMTSSE